MPSDTLIKLVSQLLEGFDIPVEKIEAVSSGSRTTVVISTGDPKLLIGPQGETLRALTMIARRLVAAKHGEETANFLIDVNGYYEKQMEQVRAHAKMLAQRARLFKHDVEMSPMSSYERLIIHELFAEDPEIKTESQGTGKFRHIVLKYQEEKSPTV